MWEKILIEGVLHRRSHSIPLTLCRNRHVTITPCFLFLLNFPEYLREEIVVLLWSNFVFFFTKMGFEVRNTNTGDSECQVGFKSRQRKDEHSTLKSHTFFCYIYVTKIQNLNKHSLPIGLVTETSICRQMFGIYG